MLNAPNKQQEEDEGLHCPCSEGSACKSVADVDRISHLYCKGTLSLNGFCSYSCSGEKSASDTAHVPPGDGVDLVREETKAS